MKRGAQALAFLFLRSHHTELVRQVQYLRMENQILRARLPKRIVVTPAERSRLLKFGRPLGPAIRHLISIVHPRTFDRWKAAERHGVIRRRRSKAPNKGGRPRKSSLVRDLVLRMARETDWGLTRIAAEIRNLHVGPIGRTTVRNILKAHGHDTGPGRSSVTWDEFIARHAKTLWACDFLTVRSWTLRGRLDLYLLAFIHIASRRVIVSPATRNPDGAWMAQQARNFTMRVEDAGLACSYVIRDRDSKYTRRFDEIVWGATGARLQRLTPRSPNLRLRRAVHPDAQARVPESLRGVRREAPEPPRGRVRGLLPRVPATSGDRECGAGAGGSVLS